jgi:hypothetical protein
MNFASITTSFAQSTPIFIDNEIMGELVQEVELIGIMEVEA